MTRSAAASLDEIIYGGGIQLAERCRTGRPIVGECVIKGGHVTLLRGALERGFSNRGTFAAGGEMATSK